MDFVVDWAPNAHVGLSGALAIFAPTHGGEAFFGNGDTWLGFMLYATLRF